jgi:beta-xylosidase
MKPKLKQLISLIGLIVMSNLSTLLGIVLFLTINNTNAQNPLILNQYTADPTARVFGDRLYVYPSHDILGSPGKGKIGWFCMEDYHVFSSENLTDWTDHGVIVSQNKVKWVDSTTYSMWAPDCIFRNGKYYFYFPAPAKDPIYGRGSTVGVAISDKPYGPFIPQPTPIDKVHGIDPNVFIDKDGQAYLYWASGKFFMAKLKDNMLELASEVSQPVAFPQTGLIEGPFLFERNGIYYMTYPHVQNKIERLEYATSNNPMGPFTYGGVLMDESASGCWTNHQSVVNFNNQWYLFYHNNDMSPKFDKNRSIRADSLFFNNDGTIRKVIPTLRGVGITPATNKIQIDRYSLKSEKGVSVTFLDSLNYMGGWKTMLANKDAWIQYNSVDFGKNKLKTVNLRASSKTGGTLQIRLDNINGPVIAKIEIPKGKEWNLATTILSKTYFGIHNLVVQLQDDNNIEIDWVSFK